LPEEIARRDRLREKLEQARARIEARAKAKAAEERTDYERKCKAGEKRKGLTKGPFIKEPDPTPVNQILVHVRSNHFTKSPANGQVRGVSAAPYAVGSAV
jgi:hypothetical protein